MKTALKVILLLACFWSIRSFAQVGPLPCGAVSSLTTWRQDFSYLIGQVVILNGVTYQSLTNNNLNQNPCTFSGTQWSNIVGTGGGQVYNLANYTTLGLAPSGKAYVVPSQITGSVTDAFAAINAAALTLPSAGGTIDATGLGSATYTVTAQLTALNIANKPITLLLNPGTTFLINTSFTTPTNTPASCAVPVGPPAASQGSAIVVPGLNRFGGNFQVGPAARVWDVVCNGDFTGNQETLRLDGVVVQGNASATVMGSLMHLAGVFTPTHVDNSGTYQCFAQCLRLDAGTTGTGGSALGDISFSNDHFADTYGTGGTYPGSVVLMDALSSSGGLSNVNFFGGMIEGNGPHNALLVINGRGSVQVSGIGFFGTTFQTASATPSVANPNVDPIQLIDVSQVLFTNLRVAGNQSPTGQPNLVDISTTTSAKVNYAININQVEAFTGDFTCLVNNSIDSTCEPGYPTGVGDTVLPNYTYGQVFPIIRQTNYAPSGACINSSIWGNSNGTTAATTDYQCINNVWVGFSTGGGGSTNPAGANTQVQFNNSGSFGADVTFAFNNSSKTLFTQELSNSDVITTRNLVLSGATSGTVTQTALSVAGTPTVTWGSSSGTPAVSATSPLAIDSTGNISITSGLLPSAPGYGYAPISTGAGTAYSAQITPLSFGSNGVQYIQQPLGSGFFPTFAVNTFGNVFYVDGFSSYSGVGQAVVAWASGPNFKQCQVVSNSGLFYINLNAGTSGSVPPGTNTGVWYPVPNNLPSTNTDCASYTANSYTRSQNKGSLVQFGSGNYTMNQGFVYQITGSSFGDEFAVQFAGSGQGVTYLVYAGTAGIPMFSRPNGAANFASMSIHDMTLDGGGLASSIMDLDTLNQSYFYDLSMGHVAPGSDHVAQYAHTGGFGFQVFTKNINIGVFPDQNFPNCAQITASGTTTIAFTVTNGGTCYHAPTAAIVPHVQLRGTQAGTAAFPCTVMPTGGGVPTFTGNALTSITSMTGGTGCVGPYFVQVYESTPVNYGIIFDNSDSSAEDITSYVGDTAAFSVNAGNFVGTHLHPSVVPNGIIWNASGALVGTEIDDVFDKAFILNQPFTTTGLSITGTNGYVGCGGVSRINAGSTMYYFSATTVKVNIGDSASLFDGGGTNSTCNAGWNELLTQSGPILAPSDFAIKAPTGFSITGNDKSLTQTATIGDYIPVLTVGVLSGAGVSTVSNSDSTLTISPTSGAVVASLNLAHGNTWTAQQTFSNGNAFSASGDGTFTGGKGVIFRNSGGSQMKLLSDPSNSTFLGWDFTDVGNSLSPFKVSSVTGNGAIGAMAVGTGACYMWTTGLAAAATAFLCNPSSNTYSLGSTAAGTNGTLNLAALNATLVTSTAASITALTAGSVTVGGDSTFNAAPRAFLDTSTGPLTAIVANGQYSPVKVVKSGTIENIEGTASAFTCTVNPVLTLEDCGTSAGVCASPTALASVTLTAANTITDGSVSSATLTAGHYLAWETTAGTCTSVGLSASAEYRMN